MFRGGFKLFTILGDRCRECPGLALVLQRFPISWGEPGNCCKVYPVYTLFRASILDFRPRLGNRCSVIAAAVRNGPPATSVAAKRFSVRFYSSLPQKRTARLLRPSPHRPSASDSILRCRKEEWPACSVRSGDEFRVLF